MWRQTRSKDNGSKEERRRWKCQFCSFSTNSLETLQLHMIAFHWDENWEEMAILTLPLAKVLRQSGPSQRPPTLSRSTRASRMPTSFSLAQLDR